MVNHDTLEGYIYDNFHYMKEYEQPMTSSHASCLIFENLYEFIKYNHGFMMQTYDSLIKINQHYGVPQFVEQLEKNRNEYLEHRAVNMKRNKRPTM